MSVDGRLADGLELGIELASGRRRHVRQHRVSVDEAVRSSWRRPLWLVPQDQRLAAGTLSSLPGLLSSHARKETQSLCTRVSLIDAYTYARVTYTYILSTTFDHWLQSILPRLYRSNALVLAAHVSCCCCCSALAICVTLVKESCDSQPRRKQTAARCVREHTESGAKNALDYSTRDDKLSLARSLSLSLLS